MKKIIIAVILLLVMGIAGCGNNNDEITQASRQSQAVFVEWKSI